MQQSHTKFSLAPTAILSTDADTRRARNRLNFSHQTWLHQLRTGQSFPSSHRPSHLRQYVFKYGVQIRIANIALFPSILLLSFSSLFLCRATYFPRVCCHTFLLPSFSAQKIIAECHKKFVHGARLILWVLGCVIIKLSSRNSCSVLSTIHSGAVFDFPPCEAN